MTDVDRSLYVLTEKMGFKQMLLKTLNPMINPKPVH